MNKLIIPTGYMGSGSSALTDLLSEFDNIRAPYNDFEYVFLHCPNGVFDLEDKLIIGNNAIRSDEALRSFRLAMSELFTSRLWWVGNYKKRLSKSFMDITDVYINELTQFRSDNYWYYQEHRDIRVLPQLFAKRIFSNWRLSIPLKYHGMKISLPTKEEFYSASKKYLRSLFNELGLSDNNLILDQLLLPFNTWRMKNYFDDQTECFVVERDPRDIFLINKYVWLPQGIPVPYPTDVHEFCNYYTRVRNIERLTNDTHVHVIHFEDLIYRYEETVNKLERILNIRHIEKGRTKFNPIISMANTQLFNIDAYKTEAEIIAQSLHYYLYDFPEKYVPSRENIF